MTGFQAGPETTGDQRFGWTRFQKKPDNLAWTVAFGELRAFWVSEGDTTVVTDDEVELPICGSSKSPCASGTGPPSGATRPFLEPRHGLRRASRTILERFHACQHAE